MSENEKQDEEFDPLRIDHVVLQQLLATGVPMEIAKAFVCFRFHINCPWGLGKVKIGDMETYSVVRPANEEMTQVECVFVATREGMPLSDMRGLEQIPDKSQLN